MGETLGNNSVASNGELQNKGSTTRKTTRERGREREQRKRAKEKRDTAHALHQQGSREWHKKAHRVLHPVRV